jgi:hypothetical protein
VKEGQLPTWEVGDNWVWSYTTPEGTTQNYTYEVTGEETIDGRDCYVIEMLYDSSSQKIWMDKATLIYELKMESTYSSNGTAHTRTETSSYNPWPSLFPLEIGKEVETEQTTTLFLDGSQVVDPMVATIKYKVDSKEDVTVTAGTFSCWKLIMYDGAGNVSGTMWWSDQVEYVVKTADADGNTMIQLQSYSVS